MIFEYLLCACVARSLEAGIAAFAAFVDRVIRSTGRGSAIMKRAFQVI